MKVPAAIHEQPHYELASSELATWIEQQGAEKWWAVDGDPYLSSRLPGACRADEVAAVLRRANRPLLVGDPQLRSDARGQTVTAKELTSLTRRGDSAVFDALSLPVPRWNDDRHFWLCWKGEANEWLLMEDSGATEAFRDVITEPLTAQ